MKDSIVAKYTPKIKVDLNEIHVLTNKRRMRGVKPP